MTTETTTPISAFCAPELVGQIVVVIGGSAGTAWRPRDARGPRAPTSSSRPAIPSAWNRLRSSSALRAPPPSTPAIPLRWSDSSRVCQRRSTM